MAAHAAQTALLDAVAGQVDVVVTHWPPTRDAIPVRLEGDALNCYYVNARADLVRQVGARLWISGHVHEGYDYQVGRTRCVSNPVGYPDEVQTSSLFRPDRVVEI